MELTPLTDAQLQQVQNFGGVAEQIEAIVTCTNEVQYSHKHYSVQIIKGDKLLNELKYCGPDELAEILDVHTDRDLGDINAVAIDGLAVGESARVVGWYATDALDIAQGDDLIDFFNLEWEQV